MSDSGRGVIRHEGVRPPPRPGSLLAKPARAIGGRPEACRGLGLAFGYNREELASDYLSGDGLIALHRDVTSAGGNLLINVGPMADATIPNEQRAPLIALGKTLS